ncbi:hypothetical protein SAMN06265219_11340 [Gracilimonas mengyeensis]|uniref:Uncharacterized protein n=1 Tax=Gracilimonas mengyeensis TaxID=1302730 RepID=A0A521EQ62_9BACT|nr:hypothetical protein SAMN06265219_11340 [Gracilimonas mengyeensis]
MALMDKREKREFLLIRAGNFAHKKSHNRLGVAFKSKISNLHQGAVESHFNSYSIICSAGDLKEPYNAFVSASQASALFPND